MAESIAPGSFSASHSTAFSMNGASFCPIFVKAFSAVVLILSHERERPPSIVSNAAVALPADSIVASMAVPNAAAPVADVSAMTAEPASIEPKRSTTSTPISIEPFFIRSNACLTFPPSAMNSLKPFPAIARNALSAIVPAFPSSESAPFICTAATEVGT
ncbi:hypothetical protein LCGC14_3105330, partial [marine sediment metagenome]